MNKTMSNLKALSPTGTPMNKDIHSSLSQREIKTHIKVIPMTTKARTIEDKPERITFYAPRGQRHQLPALVGEFREVRTPVHYTSTDEFPVFTEPNVPKKQIKDFRNTQSIDNPSYIPRQSMTAKVI